MQGIHQDCFSLGHVFSRRAIPWKLLEKANREKKTTKKTQNSAFDTYKNVSIFGIHVKV